MPQKESAFQASLIRELKELFPGSVILKNDANYLQGIPDLVIFFKKRWGFLETKRSSNASKRPNQAYYVAKLNDMSYASFISPENKAEVLHELQQALQPRRATRVSQR